MSIATAAKQIICERSPIAGGAESISLVQNEHMNLFRAGDPTVTANAPDIYMPMLDTAEVVAKRYNISREAQDEYALESQMRTGLKIARHRSVGTERSLRRAGYSLSRYASPQR